MTVTTNEPDAIGKLTAISALNACDLTLSRGGNRILSAANVAIHPGKVTTIIGPNGCGKSTMISALGRQLRPDAGRITLGGRDVFSFRPPDFARQVAMLPQSPSAPAELTVEELVGRGRHPHHTWLRRWTAQDEAIVDAALAETGMQSLAHRPIGALSGGQRQRAWLAMVLAQKSPILLLDEPTTYLDLVHSLEILTVVQRLCRNGDRTVVMVLHDLNLAARFSDFLILVGDGSVVAEGPPAKVLTEQSLAEVFRLKARIIVDPITQGTHVVPDRPLRGSSSM